MYGIYFSKVTQIFNRARGIIFSLSVLVVNEWDFLRPKTHKNIFINEVYLREMRVFKSLVKNVNSPYLNAVYKTYTLLVYFL